VKRYSGVANSRLGMRKCFAESEERSKLKLWGFEDARRSDGLFWGQPRDPWRNARDSLLDQLKWHGTLALAHGPECTRLVT